MKEEETEPEKQARLPAGKPGGRTAAVKIKENVWEIPQTFKEGMNVPARIYASEKLMEQMDDAVFEQLTNVACLPGIVKFAHCMPDAHSGYGFPIGGVAAFDPEKNGVISPGGIGFDINCLGGNSKILDEHGAYRLIKDMDGRFARTNLRCIALQNKHEDTATAIAFLKKKSNSKVYRVRTLAGHEIIATQDHPFLTPDGMVVLDKLGRGSKTAIYPFEGVPYQEEQNDTVISEDHIRALPAPLNTDHVVNELVKRKLLPLKRNDFRLPYLIKIIGYNMGDGHLVVAGKEQKAMAWFWGEPEDLEDIRKDVARIGFTPSRVYKRTRHHKIRTLYGPVEFNDTEYAIRVSAQSFVALLHALGAPIGNKARQAYGVPEWLMASPLWHQRLFLASYFGAEMSAPKTLTNNHSTFYMPAVSINKVEAFVSAGQKFLKEISLMLSSLGIKSVISKPEENYVNEKGEKSYRVRIQINGDNENLSKLYGRIGFEYNRSKRWLSLIATQYVRLKEVLVQARTALQEGVMQLYANGTSVAELVETFAMLWANKRFIQRSVYEGRKTEPRIPASFPSFESFCKMSTYGLEKSGMVWDVIIEKEEIPHDDLVYDFTVNHNDHNFIANSFVVSNCGMRLVTTTLAEKDVKPKIKELVDTLFNRVPAGVGSKGFLKLTQGQFKDVMQAGSKWCVEQGYGWDEDLERTEDSGCISWANPDKISDRAVQRGITQLGTLGSGNHYLEVQVARNIFDDKTAKKFGITSNDQVCVMVHCGSRGFGHQVASDYLRVFLNKMKDYGIVVRDRELACAPFNSKEGQDYFQGMACAANAAFANRQVILHRIRECFSKVFNTSPENLGMHLVYDVAHNIAKVEEHKVNGETRKLIVHRKGATRCFGPGRKELAPVFRELGQPVIVGGSMETGSYLLLGTEKALEETWGSTAHGSGRTMSRTKAKHLVRGETLQKEMERRGIYVRTVSYSGLAEEAGFAYKPISEVVDVMHNLGISKKVVGFKPIGNVKG